MTTKQPDRESQLNAQDRLTTSLLEAVWKGAHHGLLIVDAISKQNTRYQFCRGLHHRTHTGRDHRATLLRIRAFPRAEGLCARPCKRNGGALDVSSHGPW